MNTIVELQVVKGGLDPSVISAERADAAKWVAEYQAFEDDLVRSGKQTLYEADYAPAPFYASHSRTLRTNDVFVGDYANKNMLQKYPIATLIGIITTATGTVLAGRVAIRRLFKL